jgi:hypothetical protein
MNKQNIGYNECERCGSLAPNDIPRYRDYILCGYCREAVWDLDYLESRRKHTDNQPVDILDLHDCYFFK